MGGKKVVWAVVLVVVAVVVVVFTVRRQISAPAPPPSVLHAKTERIQVAPPFEVRAFTNEQWMEASVDRATSYRKIDGKLWAEKIECAACKQPIPAAPVNAEAGGPLRLRQYMCPRCKKQAYVTD